MFNQKSRIAIKKIDGLFSRVPVPVRRALRVFLLMLLDALCVLLALKIAQFIRFGWVIPKEQTLQFRLNLPWLLAIYLGVMFLFSQYRVLWRYATGRELFFQAIVLSLAGGMTLLWNGVFDRGMSRAVLAGACLYMIGLTTASRLFARSLCARIRKAGLLTSENNKNLPTLLIVGAGEAASFILTQNRWGGKPYGRVAGLVDDDCNKQHMRIQNVPVLGSIADIPRLADQLGIREIIIAMPSVTGKRMQEIIEICNSTRCQVRIMSDPQEANTLADNSRIVLREPNLADFLSRDEISIDDEQVGAFLRGQVVLVTGGGGSIGAEICRQVMIYAPQKLLIFDIYENCAYELLVELQRLHGADCPVQVLIGSVRDANRLNQVMKEHRPQVIFHAAAHKHVPLMEISPAEAVKNNVFGTLNVLEAGERHGVERFVMLSTDKAVNPTSVMGATKRAAETVMQQFARTSQMRCCAVRFGNVLGSHGSVIPLFESQIRAGGPVHLTHPEITRYFMTIPEAASLVLQACTIAQSGRIYILDMGEPVLILELAKKLIRFYGYDPETDMPIQVTGLRPGEKLHEELLMDEEQSALARTCHQKILVAPPLAKEPDAIASALEQLRLAAQDQDAKVLYRAIKAMVPDYTYTPNNRLAEDEDNLF